MKSTNASVFQRVKDISEFLMQGNSREYIIQYSSENWNVGERQTDKYIQKARDIISASVKRSVDYEYAKAMRRYEELYRLNIERKDYKTALAVNKEITALQGLYKNQVEHSGEIKFICSIPD